MKPKTTRKFYVEYLSAGIWWRFCIGFVSLAAARKYRVSLSDDMRRIIEVITTEKVHKV